MSRYPLSNLLVSLSSLMAVADEDATTAASSGKQEHKTPQSGSRQRSGKNKKR